MARRINTKFLGIAVASVAGVLTAGYFTQKLLVKERPQTYVETGKRFMRERQWEDATTAFRRAAQLDSSDPAIQVWLADSIEPQRDTDPQKLGRAQFTALQRALEIDPKHLPALKRMLGLAQQSASNPYYSITETAQTADFVTDIAKRILEQEPDNLDVQALQDQLPMQLWLRGVELDDEKIKNHIASLDAMVEQRPDNADLLTIAASVHLRRAAEFSLAGRDRAAAVTEEVTAARLVESATTGADKLLAEASASPAATTNPSVTTETRVKVATVYSRASDIYTRLEQFALGQRDKKKAADYATKADAAIDRAEALISPSDPPYVQIRVQAANVRVMHNQPEKAEVKLRELVQASPQDPIARLALIRLLSRRIDKTDEALKLVQSTLDLVERTPRFKSLEFELRSYSGQLRLQQYTKLKPGPERAQLVKDIQSDVSAVEDLSGDSEGKLIVQALTLRGKMELTFGKNVDAIQTLNRARVLADQKQGGADTNLLMLLANGYLQTQQTGQARTLLQDAIDKNPDFLAARALLAELLFAANEQDAARQQMRKIEELAPDAPELARLRLRSLDPKKDIKQIEEMFAKLPEEDRPQRYNKAQAALSIKRVDEVKRLLNQILSTEPGDAEAAELMSKVLMSTGDKQGAQAVIAAALEKQPDNARLRLLADAARGATAAEITQTRRELIAKNPDEFQREMQLFDVARDENKTDEALVHAKRAVALKPDDSQAMGLLFQTYLARREFAEAEKLLEPLAKTNSDQANGLLYAIKLEQVRGDLPKAKDLARELTRKLPEFALSHFTLGQVLQQSGEYEDAIAKYALALEKQPDNVEAIRSTIRCYYAINRPEDAKRYIDLGVKQRPNDPVMRDLLIKHYLNTRESEKAIPLMQEDAQRNPSDPNQLMGLGTAYYRAARERAMKGDNEGTLKFAKLAIDTLQAGIATWPDVRAFYSYLAEILLNTNDAAGGEKILKALAERPAWKGKPEPLAQLAEFYGKAGRLDDAEASLREALKLSGNSADIQLPLANLLFQRGKPDDAIKVLSDANATDPRVIRQRIEVMINSGKMDDAEAAVSAALRDIDAIKSPTDADTQNRMELLALSGLNAMNQAKFDLAIQRLDQAVALSDKSARAMFWRGLCRLRQPQPNLPAALVDLQSARDLMPDNPDVRLALVDAYAGNGDSFSATAELEAVVSMSPLNKMARLRLINAYSTARPPQWRSVEQLLEQAKAQPQFAKDPDWPDAESNMWLARGEFDKAMAANQVAQKLAPGNPKVANTFLQILLASRNYETLIRETDKLLKESGDIWWLRVARAQAKRGLEDKVGAMDELAAALSAADAKKDESAQTRIIQAIAQLVGVDDAIAKIAPRAKEDPKWLVPLAVLQQAKGDDAAAKVVADDMMRRLNDYDPARRSAVLRTAGVIYLTAKPPLVTQATDAYDKLLAIEPDDTAALNNLACLWVDTASPADPARAMTYSKRAYDVVQRKGGFEPLIFDTHGWVLLKNGRAEEAIELLRQVTDRSPFLEAHYHLAEAYLAKSFPEEAQKQLASAQELLDQAVRTKQPVDAKLKSAVEDALDRTQKALVQKTQAAAP